LELGVVVVPRLADEARLKRVGRIMEAVWPYRDIASGSARGVRLIGVVGCGSSAHQAASRYLAWP
jgi:hypothetical protein